MQRPLLVMVGLAVSFVTFSFGKKWLTLTSFDQQCLYVGLWYFTCSCLISLGFINRMGVHWNVLRVMTAIEHREAHEADVRITQRIVGCILASAVLVLVGSMILSTY